MKHYSIIAVFLFSNAMFVASARCEQSEVRLLPREVTLTGTESTHQVLVEQFNGDEAIGPAAEDVTLVSDDPKIVRVDGRTLIPVSDGSTVVRAAGTTSDKSAQNVKVRGMTQPFDWSFRNHVEPVLARQGCNSGACHGALAGKGGFKLSLRGYDPERDYFTIVEQQLGRRVEFSDPSASLLLTKPSMAVPHKGGLKLKTDSWHYKAVAEWIAAGAVAPAETDARIQTLEILPARATLKAGVVQPLLVRAHYSDGRVEDVTQLAKFTSSNEAVSTGAMAPAAIHSATAL